MKLSSVRFSWLLPQADLKTLELFMEVCVLEKSFLFKQNYELNYYAQ